MECLFSCRFGVFRTRNTDSANVEFTNTNDLYGWKRPTATRNASYDSILKTYASLPPKTVIEHLESARDGLTQEDATRRLAINGPNVLSCKKPSTWWMLALSILPDPFNILLLSIAIISAVHQPRQWTTFTTLNFMIVISFSLRFWQEYRSNVAAIKLQEELPMKALVRRRVNGYIKDMLVNEKSIVPGDILLVNPGDAVPADCMLLSSLNLSVSQSSLTGESEPQRKTLASQPAIKNMPVFELENLIFKGTGVISGSGLAIVLKTGDDAFISTIFKSLNRKRPLNSFRRGIRRVTYIMIIFMLIMVPIVLVVSGVTTKKWGNAVFLAVSVAVGLVPEMLPAIVNANLARGAFALSKKGAVVKRLDSVQVLGAMSVLCSDKTGTLTKDEIALCHHVDVSGNQSPEVLQLAYTNAVCQSGKKNGIDTAILNCMNTEEKQFDMSQRVGELPFNFESRRSSCIVRRPSGKLKIICKGALEEVLSQSKYIRVNNESLELDDQLRQNLLRTATAFNFDGYRVVLVATGDILDGELSREDFDGLDSNLIIEGLLTFLDPPKDDAKASVARLQALGIDVRVLTGDSIGVAMKVCRSLELIKEIDDENIQAITGPTLAQLEGEEFHRVVKHCKIFAKLTPSQKGDVINSLKEQGEVVGMLGDGINDYVALCNADAGISVDTGTSVAKECADIILTQKELPIIAESIVVGRMTQGNTIKYIKMVASSNFGNVFSLLISSAWVPFNPMTPLQILVQNVLYDISQIGIPWDHMDPEYLGVPQQWAIWDLLRFILVLGPTSSTIDIATYCINWFYYGTRSPQDEHGVKLFQSQWYLVGLLTQTLVVYLLRTHKFPFIESRPSKAVVMSTVPIMILGFVILYIPPFANALGFVRPELSFLGFFAALVVLYVLEVQLVKIIYIKLFGRWL